MDKKHISQARRKLRAAARKVTAKRLGNVPRLFYLTDPVRTPDPVKTAKNLPAGTAIIYRHFGASDKAVLARQLAKIARRRHLYLLISADPELARNVGAAGVHWPERCVRQARYCAGKFGIQTISAHSHKAISRSHSNRFDAVLVSTVSASSSPSAGKAMGSIRFRKLALTTAKPLVGLGGLVPENAASISGFASIAAIEGIEAAFN